MKRVSSRKAASRKVTASFAGIAAIFLFAVAIFAAPVVLAAKNKKDKKKAAESSKALKGLPVQDLSEDEAILQAFNRLGFGLVPAIWNASSKWACKRGSTANFIPNRSTTPHSMRASNVFPR